MSKIIKKEYPEPTKLFHDIKRMIEDGRTQLTIAVNATLTMLYWQIGKRINEEVLGSTRAAYGSEIVVILSRQLSTMYGTGFTAKNIRHMMKFAETFPSLEIVSTLSRQLSWSHFKEVIYLKEPLQREFYAEMCRIEKWSVRTLRDRIDSMLYERTALSKKPDELIAMELQKLRENDQITPNLLLKDPYILDFLELNDHYFERDLEDAILREMEQFLLELGAGFTFVARQKRIQIDDDDFYIDLLLYNRRLKALVVIDLKRGPLKLNIKARWSYTCAILQKTNWKRGNIHRWV